VLVILLFTCWQVHAMELAWGRTRHVRLWRYTWHQVSLPAVQVRYDCRWVGQLYRYDMIAGVSASCTGMIRLQVSLPAVQVRYDCRWVCQLYRNDMIASCWHAVECRWLSSGQLGAQESQLFGVILNTLSSWALGSLHSASNLPCMPRRIVCWDYQNIQALNQDHRGTSMSTDWLPRALRQLISPDCTIWWDLIRQCAVLTQKLIVVQLSLLHIWNKKLTLSLLTSADHLISISAAVIPHWPKTDRNYLTRYEVCSMTYNLLETYLCFTKSFHHSLLLLSELRLWINSPAWTYSCCWFIF